VLGIPAILVLMAVRLANRPRRKGRSRFTGSTMWQGYFVEWVILLVLTLRPAHPRLQGRRRAGLAFPTWAAPVSTRSATCCRPAAPRVTLIGLTKIVISMVWLIVIASNLTMGVAWHRFRSSSTSSSNAPRPPGRRWAACGR